MINHIDLNDDWKYSSTFSTDMIKKEYNDREMETVRLPHTNAEFPINYLDEERYQLVSCYRRHIHAEEEWRGKRVLLTFEGVAHIAKIYINGREAAVHYGGYTAFTVDLEPYLSFGEDNVITTFVDSRESCNIPPFGYVIDYLTYGGIYREVYLDIKETVSIEDAFIITRDEGEENDNLHTSQVVAFTEQSNKKDVSTKMVELQVSLHGMLSGRKYKLRHIIENSDQKAICVGVVTVSEPSITVKFRAAGVSEWDIEHPILYTMHLELFDDSEEKYIELDEKFVRFGFRTCEFKEDGFYLNRKRLKLMGLNRHQSFPYVGYAMPKRIQRLDAEILKHELGVNAVRTSHYPQSKHFIDRCDELGLLVFTEIPGWQHIGDESWKETACENVREMILQYRNHPSIILWGVRINESMDDDGFYKKTNEIAHKLDPGRQTGGVRFLKKSNLLEDVYTYNDFLYNGETRPIDKKEEVSSNKNAPYLISEYNGHMYPTKAFDEEERRLQHALRHTSVLDAICGQNGVAGGFGWCMFDYNTHKDFGSGDRICYHGVLDMFRNPKLAAFAYASQSDTADVFEISTSLDIGEHPAGNIGEIYAFTNADSVRLYKNETFIKEFYPNRARFKNLKHPPVLIDDFVGNLLEEKEQYKHKVAEDLKEVLFAVRKYGQNNLPLKFKMKMAFLMLKEHITLDEGMRLYYEYIGSWGGAATTFRFDAVKNNEVVTSIRKKPAAEPSLSIKVNDTELKEVETYDVTQVRITAVDEEGNRLPFYQEPIGLETWGAVELIGPKVISLKGGAAGVYLKTNGSKGDGGLKITQTDLGKFEVAFKVI